MIKTLSIWALCACLLAATRRGPCRHGDMAPNDKQLAALYWQGHELLKKSDWTRRANVSAASKQRCARRNPPAPMRPSTGRPMPLCRPDAPPKRRRPSKSFSATSRTVAGARMPTACCARSNPGPEAKRRAAGDDEELAEIAVTGLMQAPPERAMPILRKVLKGSHSLEVKKRALFVLSQLDEVAALETLGDVASSSSDPELREEAIRMLGVCGEDKAIDRLQAIYASSKSSEDKRSIIQAWLIADRPTAGHAGGTQRDRRGSAPVRDPGARRDGRDQRAEGIVRQRKVAGKPQGHPAVVWRGWRFGNACLDRRIHPAR